MNRWQERENAIPYYPILPRLFNGAHLNVGPLIRIPGFLMSWDVFAGEYKLVSIFSPSGIVSMGYIGDSIVRAAGGIGLSACLQSSGRLRHVRNAGVSGETTAQILARLPAFLAANPMNLCGIGCGTNDGRAAVPVATFEAGVRGIVAACRAAGVTPFFTTCPPNNESSTIRAAIHANNRILQKVCKELGVLLSIRWEALNDGTFSYKAGTNTDSIHPAVWTLLSEGAGLVADLAAAGLLPAKTGADLLVVPASVNLFTNANLLASSGGLATGITNIGAFTPTIGTGATDNCQVCTKVANVTASGPRLSFPVVAGRKYRVRFFASYNVSGVTNGKYQTNNSQSDEMAYKHIDTDLLVPAGTFTFWYDDVFTAKATGATDITIYDDASGAGSSMVIKVEQIAIIDCTANPEYLK